jgi:hypothetical protein
LVFQGLGSTIASPTPREIRLEAHRRVSFPLTSLQRSSMIEGDNDCLPLAKMPESCIAAESAAPSKSRYHPRYAQLLYSQDKGLTAG